ncbi:MAG: DUF4276 family protein [Bacteroidetes bacterium]|nr:DUF4276 family protein [Bacteroidota bacterium]
MVDRRLFIEGTKEIRNGNLREGFGMLIEQKVRDKLLRIDMGGGKEQTINKFKHSTNSKLLCDLDAPSPEIENDLKKNALEKAKDSVFYMIQEMEAWFISQPKILDQFYNMEISKRLPQKNASAFANPDEELQRITKDTKKGTYHKVNHGAQLLKLLDADKLYHDFPDFQRLIDSFK